MKLTNCKSFEGLQAWSKMKEAWFVRGDMVTRASEIRPYFENGIIHAHVHVFFEVNGHVFTEITVSELYSSKKEAMDLVKNRKEQLFEIKVFSNTMEKWTCQVKVVDNRGQELDRVIDKLPSFFEFVIYVENEKDVEAAIGKALEAARKFVDSKTDEWTKRKRRFLRDADHILNNRGQWAERMKNQGGIFLEEEK